MLYSYYTTNVNLLFFHKFIISTFRIMRKDYINLFDWITRYFLFQIKS